MANGATTIEPEAEERTFSINFGPQHPAAHGVLRLVLELDGEEGLADVGIINALYESARQGRPVVLDEFAEDAAIVPQRRPAPEQTMTVAKPRTPRLVHARGPS